MRIFWNSMPKLFGAPAVSFLYTGEEHELVPNNVTRVEVHSSVTSIRPMVFKGCKLLEEVAFSEGLERIGEMAFRDCESLRRIKFPSTLKVIEAHVFWRCGNLAEVMLNEGLKYIRESAFEGCKLLESITFPSTVVAIDSEAFKSCNKLKDVMLDGGLLHVGGDVFSDCPALKSFRVPSISERLEAISQKSRRDIERKINSMSFVDMSEGLAFSSGVSVTERVIAFDHICSMLRSHEIKEAISIVRLALWKTRIEEAKPEKDREACRIELPGPAINTILQYLPENQLNLSDESFLQFWQAMREHCGQKTQYSK